MTRWLAAVLAVTAITAAACGQSAPPPPLAASSTTGVVCIPAPAGQPVTMGIWALENDSNSKVTVSVVSLTGGTGQRMSSPFLVPIANRTLIGDPLWPPTGAVWAQRKPASGGIIAAHQALNLVIALTRTSAHPKPATVVVTYTAAGNSYTLTEGLRVLASAGPC
jgi:hypothetical protein